MKFDKNSPVYNAIYEIFKGKLNKEEHELIQYDNVQGWSILGKMYKGIIGMKNL